MDNTSIREKIANKIKDSIEEDVELKNETNLFDDLGVDSIMLINLIVDIEDEWDIELEDDDLDVEKLSSFDNLCNVVIDKVSRMG